ncbi:MAG: DUF4836 family protein [Ferruginibacter sp.]
MTKRIFSLTLAAFAAVIIFASCSKKTNKEGRYVPATAGVVMHINGESLNAKLPWDEIKQNDVFKKMIDDTSVSSFAKSILENPENSGVNTKGDIIVFVVKDSLGSYAAVEGIIKDESKFKTMLTSALTAGKETSKDGFTFYADEKTSVAYNKEKFIVTYNTPEIADMNKAIASPMDTDTTGNVQTPVAARDMNAISAAVLNLKEDASLAKDEKFSALMAEKGDAHFWFNAQYFTPTQALAGIGAMANLSKVYEGAITTASINFENGKINFDAKSYGGKEITALYKKYSGTDFDKTMVKNIPSKNLAGLFAFNFKPEGVKEFLKLLNMDGLVNLGAAQAGFNLDDFVKANKGDILIAVTDIKRDSIDGEGANFIFAASINDKPSFNKIIDAGKKFGGPMFGGENKYAYNVNDKYFVFTNNKTATDTYIAGTANTSFDFMDKISGGPFGGFVNFQYIFNNMKPKATTDSFDVAMYNASVKIWDNLLISGGNFKDGGVTQHVEVNLLDKNTNSLKQLNSYLGTMANIQEKKKANNTMDWMNEDATAPAMDSAVMPSAK